MVKQQESRNVASAVNNDMMLRRLVHM